MTRARLAIVGGGVWAAKLCGVLAEVVPHDEVEICLAARRLDRLRVIAEHARRRIASQRRGWCIRAEPLEAAVSGADGVVLMVRVGGLAARARDEALPARFGWIGDEGIGAGGIANAWRTVPAIDEIAALLARVAPRAWILNLTAPLGVATRVLLDHGLRAAGVCELPLVTRDALHAAAEDEPGPDALRYAGLNHLGWFWAQGEAGYATLRRAVAVGLVDAEVLAHFAAAPLHYYYDVFDPDAAARLRRRRATGRAQQLADLDARLIARLAAAPGDDMIEFAERPTPWFDRAVVPLVAAALGGPPVASHLDVRNDGLVPELPRDAIVELAARWDGRSAVAQPPGPLPPRVATFSTAVARAEALALDAARRRDAHGLAAAVAALPLPRSVEFAEDVASAIVAAERQAASQEESAA